MKTIVAAAVIAASVSAASGAVLWDQPHNYTLPGTPNTHTTGFLAPQQYLVGDVSVGASGWTIESISMYWAKISSSYEFSAINARVYVQPKTGALPTVAPAATLYPVTVTVLNDPSVSQNYYKMTVSGLSIPVSQGDWWVGITPLLPNSPFGDYNALASSSTHGVLSPRFIPSPSPGAWSASTIEAAITVEGLIPTPGTAGLLGVGALGLMRRRRAV